jgi:fucose 4-O-acetylase-like acetyltransferase
VPDNLRGVLLLLVGVGHGLEPLLGSSPAARAAYSALYLFHVPAFAALSGHLSRPRWPPAAQWRALLVPLVVGQALYACLDALWLGHPLSATWLVQPYWVLWFLLSLATWRALLPLWARLRWPLAWAGGASLAAGLFPQVGYPLSLSRTLAFLPFFVAGHAVPGPWLAWLRRGGGRLFGALAFAALLAWACALASGALPFPDTRLLYGSTDYAGMGMTPLQGVLARAAVTAGALLLAAAAWALSPEGDGWLSRVGAASLWPYVLHGLLLRATPLQGWLQGLAPLLQVPAASLAGLGAVLLPAARTLRGSGPPPDRAR